MGAQHDLDQKMKKNNGSDHSGHEKDEKLNGTFTSVLLLGAFIVVSWIAVFLLFIDRA